MLSVVLVEVLRGTPVGSLPTSLTGPTGVVLAGLGLTFDESGRGSFPRPTVGLDGIFAEAGGAWAADVGEAADFLRNMEGSLLDVPFSAVRAASCAAFSRLSRSRHFLSRSRSSGPLMCSRATKKCSTAVTGFECLTVEAPRCTFARIEVAGCVTACDMSLRWR
jgi:hypothetical protein